LALLVGALSGFGACASDGGGVGAACTVNADCASGNACVYRISDGCAATPSCQPKPTGPLCRSVSSYCACSGGTIGVSCGNPDGYAPLPVLRPALSASDCTSSDAGP
jgi:hypothetical protein